MITPDDLNAIIDRIAAGNYTAEDLQVLRREIVLSSDRNVVQLGKYNVNIAEGKDIHVGDRIYQGADADTIRNLLRDTIKSLLREQRINQTISPDKESLREALIMARRTLTFLERQAAAYTFLSMPPELQINLEEQRRKVAELEGKGTEIKAQLAQLNGNIIESTETLIKPSGQGMIRVEKGRIINYDFEPLVTKLNKVLDCLGRNGALAFKVRLGKESVLEEYVIPRIQNQLKAKVTRIDPSHTWEDAKRISIDKYDYLEACNNRTDQLIETAFFAEYKPCHLIDWIDRSANDLLLIVKNKYISDEMQIEDITKKCWQRIYDRVCPGLEKKHRCFVTIFAHSFPKIKPYTYKSLNENKIISEFHENKIISLPFKRLQVNSLEKWFREELHEWGVIAENEYDYKRIEDYVESIKKHRGDVSETFAEIQGICQELRDRGRIIFNDK
jgi:hypothetical protein